MNFELYSVIEQVRKESMNHLSLLYLCILLVLRGIEGGNYLVKTVEKYQTSQQNIGAKDNMGKDYKIDHYIYR